MKKLSLKNMTEWRKSPGGKTAHSTLHSALQREIGAMGKKSRFRKTERGSLNATGRPPFRPRGPVWGLGSVGRGSWPNGRAGSDVGQTWALTPPVVSQS